MDTNGKLVLNGEFSRKDHGALNYAKNIQLTNDYKAIENEDGFTELYRLVDNLGENHKILGSVTIDTDVIIFLNVTISNVRYFCIVEHKGIDGVQNIILKTINIVADDTNAINATYALNSDSNRIITWSDGIKDTSNRPFSLNIDNVNDFINPLSKELIVDVDKLYMFNDVVTLDYSVDILQGGDLKGGAYYITTRCYYADDVITPWDVIRGPYYIGDESGKNFGNTIKIDVEGIPSDVKQIELAVIRRSEGVVISKLKNKYPISLDNAIANETNRTTLSFDNDEGDDVDITELLVKSSNFSKIGLLASVNNKQYIGGVEEEDSFINYQKYANDIVTSWEFADTTQDDEFENAFQEGEVYAFDISFILKSGSLTPPFHIPGREAFTQDEKDNSKDPTNNNFYLTPNINNKIKKYPNDTLLPTSFKRVSNFNDVTGKVKVLILVGGEEKGSIEYSNLSDFYKLSDTNVISTEANYNIVTELGRIDITKTTVDDPIKEDNEDYTINVICELNSESSYTNISDRFEYDELKLHGGFTYNYTPILINQSYSGANVMGYWENKNEQYYLDDTIVYPKGNVRHHRLPFIRECVNIDNLGMYMKDTRLNPVFNNIYIPDNIKSLIKGVVISFNKKDINDKTVFFSTVQPLMVNEDITEPTQSIMYGINSFCDKDNKNYLKLNNPDLVRAKKENAITHIIPFGYKDVKYKGYYPAGDDRVSRSLGYIDETESTGIVLMDYFSFNNGSGGVLKELSIPIDLHKFVEFNENKDMYDKLVNNVNHPIINNVGSDAYTALMTSFKLSNGVVVTSTALLTALSYGIEYDVLPEQLKAYSQHTGVRYYQEVTDNGGSFKSYDTNDEFLLKYMPLVYAYCYKDDVHFGIKSNHEKVIASSTPISNDLDTIVVKNGDVKKGYFKDLQTRFPYTVAVGASSYKYEGNYTWSKETKDTVDDFAVHISDFNSGEQSKLSFAVANTPYSCITDVERRYTKSDKNKIIASEDVISKVAYANPISDRTPYYDEDYNNVNVYGSPIADASYKYKNILHPNAVVWSNTANDVRTNIANFKIFKPNNRYYLPVRDGDIIQLIPKGNALYIQQRDNLSLAFVKDKLDSEGSSIYTGSGDIFDRPPKNILNSIGEAIRCKHPLHCQDTMIGIAIIDNINKAIYTVLGEEVTAISHVECDSYFKRVLNVNHENPLKEEGWMIASNNIKNTIYVTGYDADDNWTLSFNPIIGGWHSFHDYHNMYMINAIDKFYSINKGYLYLHGKDNKGLFYRDDINTNVRMKRRSFIDFVISDQRDVNKIFEAILFESKYYDVESGGYRYDKSISNVLIYNNSQCCNLRDIKEYHGDPNNEWFNINKRNVGSLWVVNDFRDAVIDNTMPFLTEEKELITSNISDIKEWFNDNLISSNSCVVRLEMDNVSNDRIELITINVYARKTNI